MRGPRHPSGPMAQSGDMEQALTALYGTDRQWALYNGAIAYGLIGLFAGVEYLVRLRVQARHAHG